jgi:hypothetical protein
MGLGRQAGPTRMVVRHEESVSEILNCGMRGRRAADALAPVFILRLSDRLSRMERGQSEYGRKYPKMNHLEGVAQSVEQRTFNP